MVTVISSLTNESDCRATCARENLRVRLTPRHLTRMECIVKTETRCGFDGLDERKEQVPSSVEISLRLSSKIEGESHG